MKKATKHRKRHTIPGPAGVLWSSLHQDEKSSHDRGDDEDEGLTQPSLFPNNRNGIFANNNEDKNKNNSHRNKKNHKHHDISPHAWSTMQQSLGIVTPYLPSRTQGDIKLRYELLRPHLPSNYVLLSEVLRGDHDVKMKKSDLCLCVWVDSIDETNIHHGVWTVELRDETGASIRAWIDTKFFHAELQKAQNDDEQSQNVVRTGVVWMLRNVSIIVFKNNSNNNNNIRSSSASSSSSIIRMLVVSENNIKESWTPEQHLAQAQPNEENDSPEAQRHYLDWMEKRKALVVLSTSEKHKERRHNHQQQQHDDDDDDDDNDEDPPEEIVYESDHDGKFSTTNTLWSQLQTESSSPLAHRDVNAIQEYEGTTKTTTDNSNDTNDEKGQNSFDLHTQLSNFSNNFKAGKDVEDNSVPMAAHLHHPSQCTTQLTTQLATQSDSPRRNHHYCNPPNQDQHLESPMREMSNETTDKDYDYDENSRNIMGTLTSDNPYTQESATYNNNNQKGSREVLSQRIMSSHFPTETIDKTIHISSTSSQSNENSQRKSDSSPTLDCTASKQKKVKEKIKKKKRYHNSSSSTNISGQCLNDMVKKQKLKKKKEEKSTSPIRKDNSPLRMAGSVWNTIDVSILQMLDTEVEKEETQTTLWNACSSPIQQRHIVLMSNTASRSRCNDNVNNARRHIGKNSIVEATQSEKEENDDESHLLNRCRSKGGPRDLFEVSSWTGINMSALSDNDD